MVIIIKSKKIQQNNFFHLCQSTLFQLISMTADKLKGKMITLQNADKVIPKAKNVKI